MHTLASTYIEALKLLPPNATKSSSFGNPGEGGYVEYLRTPDGTRYTLSNGPYHLHPFEFDWHVQKLEA